MYGQILTLGFALLVSLPAQSDTRVYVKAGASPKFQGLGDSAIFGPPTGPSRDNLSLSYLSVTATANAELTTGKIGTSCVASGIPKTAANAFMGNTLTFRISGAGNSGITRITALFSIHGTTDSTIKGVGI